MQWHDLRGGSNTISVGPNSADKLAKQRGMPLLERIRAVRLEFGLSLDAAKAVTDATDGRPPVIPEISDREQLISVLAAELGYCRRASGAATVALSDLLQAARDRSDTTGDGVEFGRASRKLEALLATGAGWAEWFVYEFEHRGFVWHGFRQTDLWITDKGRILLAAIELHGSELSGRSE